MSLFSVPTHWGSSESVRIPGPKTPTVFRRIVKHKPTRYGLIRSDLQGFLIVLLLFVLRDCEQLLSRVRVNKLFSVVRRYKYTVFT